MIRRTTLCTTALKTSIIAALTFAAFDAMADECDYTGRHYKTDFEVIGGTSYPTSRTGDIDLPASLTLVIRNSGVNAFTSDMPSGGLVSAKQMKIAVKGVVLTGYMSVPVDPGAEMRVNFSLPNGLVGMCETVSIVADPGDTFGQWGCQVHANDSITFQARFGSTIRCLRGGGLTLDEETDSLNEIDAN